MQLYSFDNKLTCTRTLTVNQLSLYFSRETLRKIKCFVAVDAIHSCYHCLKMSSYSLEKNRYQTINLTVLVINVTTAFTILNYLEQ